MKKRRVLLYLPALILAAAIFWRLSYDIITPPESSDPEFMKIMTTLDHYKEQDLEVIVDGIHFPARAACLKGRDYLARNYKKGTVAGSWIKEHCYRTNQGNIIYFKYPDGSTRPMRDVFLEFLGIPLEEDVPQESP